MSDDTTLGLLRVLLACDEIACFTYQDSKGRVSDRRVVLESVTDTHCAGVDLGQRSYRSFRIDRVRDVEPPSIHPPGGYRPATVAGKLEGPATEPLAVCPLCKLPRKSVDVVVVVDGPTLLAYCACPKGSSND